MNVRRCPFDDEYVENGESAVLLGGQVIVLSPIATTILGFVGSSTVSVREVADVLRETYGDPPDGSHLLATTTAAVEALAELGLLELSDRGAETSSVDQCGVSPFLRS